MLTDNEHTAEQASAEEAPVKKSVADRIRGVFNNGIVRLILAALTLGVAWWMTTWAITVFDVVIWIAGAVGALVLVFGKQRVGGWYGKIRPVLDPIVNTAVVLLLVAVIIASMGFLTPAPHYNTELVFYQPRWDNWLGRAILRWRVDVAFENIGPIQLAKCNAGTAVAYGGKWYLIDEAASQ